MSPNVATPGGWLELLNNRVARVLAIGTIAASGGYAAGEGELSLYGLFQGAQASHVIEASIPSTTVGTVAYSEVNPLEENETGAIMAVDTNFIFTEAAASPATKISLCTASGASQPCTKVAGGSNIASGVVLNTKDKYLALSATGGLTLKSPAILAPSNYPSPAKKYVNATFHTGSGQTTVNLDPAYIHLEVVPCNLEGVGC